MVLMLAACMMTGCASSKAYFTDRGRDAADIFTFTIGRGIGGAKVRTGPVCVAVFQNENLAGLQNGEFFCAKSWEWDLRASIVADYGIDLWVLLFGGEGYSERSGEKRKKNSDACYLFFVPLSHSWAVPENKMHYSASYWTQCEVGLGIGYPIRLGFNIGELADFFLGWFGIDIYGDDLEAKNARNNSN